MKIREMNISARAKSCLLNAGYMFVSDIMSLTDEELLSIHNLNEKCLKEIREALNKYSMESEKDDDRRNYTLSEEKVNVDELWGKIYESKKKTDDKFGDSCKLIIRNTDDIEDKEVETGTLIQCLKFAQDSMSQLGKHEWFLIQYGEQNCNTTGAFCHFADGIQEVWNLIRSIPEPFDNKIIPDQYEHFFNNRIDSNNFTLLWDKLQKIEDRYRKGINYENRYYITDWESELCYEQGKLLENVYWVGNEITIPETSIPYCTYSKMNKKRKRHIVRLSLKEYR